MAVVIAAMLSYLLGAIPFGLLLGWSQGVDIRVHGSGNIGATNLGRVLGRRWGLIGFVLDVCKGLGPTLAAGWWFGWLGPVTPGAGGALSAAEAGAWLGVAAAAMLGHVFPVYLKFRGGKGVATGLGVMLGVWPYLTLPAGGALLTWLLMAGSLRYVGWASTMAAVSLPAWFVVLAASLGWPVAVGWPFIAVTGAMALLVIYRHRGNLARTLGGVEPRLGQ